MLRIRIVMKHLSGKINIYTHVWNLEERSDMEMNGASAYYLSHLDGAYSFRSGKMTVERKYGVRKGDGSRTNCWRDFPVLFLDRRGGRKYGVSRKREFLMISIVVSKVQGDRNWKMYIEFGSREVFGCL